MGDMLYGTTENGGTIGSGDGHGTVFALDPKTGAFRTLQVFTGGADGANPFTSLVRSGEKLFGTTANGGTTNQGTIFMIDPANGDEQVVHSFKGGHNGSQPYAGLTKTGNRLYGTAAFGGHPASCGPGCATVFSFAP